MDSGSTQDTLLLLKQARDRCAAELSKMRKSVEGMQAKVHQLEAKLEMADEMYEIVKRGGQLPKKENTP
jgi:phage shock protein A